MKRLRAENPDVYRARYGEKLRRKDAKRRAKPSRIAYAANWHRENAGHRSETRRRRWREEPQFRLGEILRARLRGALGRRKSGSTAALLGCTIAEAVAHIEAQFQPGMSWENRGAWHVDHKRPLASFNLEDPAEQAAACHFTNLQPLWKLDNLRKGARYVAPQPTGQDAEIAGFYKSDCCAAHGPTTT